MKVLVVSPDFPYPPNHGGRADIWTRIKCLKMVGWNVDLLVTAPREGNESYIPVVEEYVENIFFCERKRNFFYLFKFKPYQVVSRGSLSKFRADKKYDLVILESEAVASVVDSKWLTYNSLALRVHNDESKYFRALSKGEGCLTVKLHYVLESILYSRLSKKIKSRVDFEMHISKDELELAQRVTGNGKSSSDVFFLPSHFDLKGMSEPTLRGSLRALFVGNLFTANNLAGLFWYLDNVHPLVLDEVPDYVLVVAGNTKGGDVRAKLTGYSSVEFYDSPVSLFQYYNDAAVFINPMLDGAGVKLKTLHAVYEGLPLVSTTTGVEGIGFKDKCHFLLANDSVQFSNAVTSLLKAPALGFELSVEAQKYLSLHFSAERVLSNLIKKVAAKI